MFWQVDDVPSVPDFQSIPGVPSVPCVPCFSNDPTLAFYLHDSHTCDKFEKGLREVFFSFQGGFSKLYRIYRKIVNSFQGEGGPRCRVGNVAVFQRS